MISGLDDDDNDDDDDEEEEEKKKKEEEEEEEEDMTEWLRKINVIAIMVKTSSVAGGSSVGYDHENA